MRSQRQSATKAESEPHVTSVALLMSEPVASASGRKRQKRAKKPKTLTPQSRAATVLLALDPSSTNVGWSLWDVSAARLLAGGTMKLVGSDLAIRLAAARVAANQIVDQVLDIDVPDALAYEYGAFASTGRDEQQQALGVLRMVLYERLGLTGKHTVKVAPNAAKKALTGYGKAVGTHDEDKQRMINASAVHIAGADDHTADSAGIALGAIAIIRKAILLA